MGLKSKLFFMLGFVSLIFVGTVTITFFEAVEIQKSTQVINMAGRQRMLSQKMTKEVLALKDREITDEYKDHLKKTIGLFEDSLRILEDGDEAKGVPAATDAELKIAFGAVKKVWKPFRKNLELILNSESPESNVQAYNYLLKNNLVLLKTSNGAVKIYAAQAEDKIVLLEYTLVGGALVFIFALLACFAYVTYIMKKMKFSFDSMFRSFSETSRSMSQINSSAGNASEATTSQASAIQETVATLDEINAMVARGVDAANKTRELSGETRKNAEEGKTSMQAMARSIEEISESNAVIMTEIENSNERIGNIIDVIREISNKTQVINDIVFQTKLLSFNASVEAARAGEHGKGFAVVAEEVGNLAEMSGAASKEISDMLASSIGRVESIVGETKTKVTELANTGKSKIESGVGIAQRCGAILDDVFQNVEKVDGMMEDIAMASKEQAEGVSNISAAMNELDQATQTNANVANETSVQAKAMQEQASELKAMVLNIQKVMLGDVAEALTQSTSSHRMHHEKRVETEKREKVVPIRKTEVTPTVSQVEPPKMAAGGEMPSGDDPRFEDF